MRLSSPAHLLIRLASAAETNVNCVELYPRALTYTALHTLRHPMLTHHTLQSHVIVLERFFQTKHVLIFT